MPGPYTSAMFYHAITAHVPGTVKTVPYVMITCGGPMMTKNCEVLNSDGLVIEGVYMAGEIVGMANVGGRNSIGGMGHGNCLVWGKKAAEVIAAKLGK